MLMLQMKKLFLCVIYHVVTRLKNSCLMGQRVRGIEYTTSPNGLIRHHTHRETYCSGPPLGFCQTKSTRAQLFFLQRSYNFLLTDVFHLGGTVNLWFVIISNHLLILLTHCLPLWNVTHSGNRSSKTFKPKKNIPEGSHQYELLKHAEATLGSGNLRMAVMLPEGEDLNEWVAVNSKHQFYLFSPFLMHPF